MALTIRVEAPLFLAPTNNIPVIFDDPPMVLYDCDRQEKVGECFLTNVARKPELIADAMARRLGQRIRERRSQRHLTLQQMAHSTGLSVAMLSLVERGQSNASIGSLVAICDALDISMSDLFDGLAAKTVGMVVRRADQPVYTTDQDVQRRILLDLKRYGIELAENEYAPGTRSAAQPVHHAGAEFGILLSGRLEVHVDTETYTMEPFDAIHFESRRPHLFVNPGDEPARALWVNLHHLSHITGF